MKLRRVYVAAAVAMALAAAGCANNEDSDSGTAAAPSGSSSSAAFSIDSIQKDDALAGQVDGKISSDGKLVVGTDPTYEPSEFKQGGKIVGFDVDLGTAIAKKLGLTAEFQESKFDAILPALGSRYEIGMSSFTDNPQREKVVDFVTYYNAGTQWASKDPAFDPDNACGKKVAVQTGTVQDTDDLPARQKKCGGNAIQVQRYDAQDEATNSVVLGKADAVLADSPVMAGAVKKVGGGLQLVGQVYDAAPYGIAVPKNAGTTKDAILGAVKALVADGSYKAILDTWGVSSGAITDPVINGASS
ncbi:MAG TPA: ABC transporter substrate-binding protein [Mycobacteriales bacterium]|nr:ABC transporter substrate-binding protein [Mycobacteriales bacterium]